MNTFTKPTFTEQECTLMLGESIGSNVRSSLGHAHAISTRPKRNNVLYIIRCRPIANFRIGVGSSGRIADGYG